MLYLALLLGALLALLFLAELLEAALAAVFFGDFLLAGTSSLELSEDEELEDTFLAAALLPETGVLAAALFVLQPEQRTFLCCSRLSQAASVPVSVGLAPRLSWKRPPSWKSCMKMKLQLFRWQAWLFR